MAVNIKPKYDPEFFSKVSQQARDLADALVANGATVNVEFQSVAVWKDGKHLGTHNLPVTTTAVLKGQAHTVMMQLAGGLVTFLKEVLNGVHGSGCSSHITDELMPGFKTKPKSENTPIHFDPATGMLKVEGPGNVPGGSFDPSDLTKTQAAKLLEQIKHEFPSLFDAASKAGDFQHLPASLNTPVPLKDAKYIGQAVLGTNSTYRVVAIGERVKMAINVKPSSLSVRVEGPVNMTEKKALLELGFESKGDYLSKHFKLMGVPAERVVGCLIFNSSLNLLQKATNIKDALHV